MKNASNLTEEERKTFKINKEQGHITLIRSQIRWEKVLIDSLVIAGFNGEDDFTRTIFIGPIFNGEVNFSESTFSEGVDFDESIFHKKANFTRITWKGIGSFFGHWEDDHTMTAFRGSTFHGEVDFSKSHFVSAVDFGGSTFHGEANFSESTFSEGVHFGETIFKSRSLF